MAGEFVAAAVEQLRCSTTFDVDIDPGVEEWLKKLYFHVEKHVDIEPEVMHQSCLQLLTEITVAFSESQCDSMSLHDLKLMSIQQVAETSHECATFGSLCMTQDETHSQSCVGLEYGKLIPQLMVVIGCLTGSPRRATPTEDVGALYFEDASMTVVCEVSSACSLAWLDKLVVLSSWIYISRNDFLITLLQASNQSVSLPFGYLEILDCVPFVFLDRPLQCVDLLLKVVSVDSLVSNSLPAAEQTCKVHVYGVTRAISPVIRNGMKSPYFLVELADASSAVCIPLIIQVPELLYLQQVLKLDHVYSVSHLVHVNIKGQNEKALWAGTRDTVFTEMQTSPPSIELSHNSTSPSFSSFNSLERPRGVKRPLRSITVNDAGPQAKRIVTDEGSTETGQEERVTKKQSDCCYPVMSYIGCITKCVNPQAYIFELDGKVRCYISHQLATRYGRGLRVGSQVKLTNVHLVKEKDVTGLFCCSSSKVTLQQFSLLDSPYCPMVDYTNVYFKHLPNMAPSDFVWYVNSACWLQENLKDVVSEKEVVGGFRMKAEGQKWCKGLIDKLYQAMRIRSVLSPPTTCDEVFSAPHYCKLTALQPHRLPPMKNIDHIRMISCQMEGKNGCKLDSWSAFTDASSEVVVGVLSSCFVSGRLQLTDSSGSIDILTVKLGSSIQTGCSYALPSQIGGIWAIRNFKMVCETIDVKKGDNAKSIFPYLLVDMNQCVQLRPKRGDSRNKLCCCLCPDKSKNASQTSLDCLILILTVKDPLTIKQFYAQFSVEGNSQTVLVEFYDLEVNYYDLLRVGRRYRIDGLCAKCLEKRKVMNVFQPIRFDSNIMRLAEEPSCEDIRIQHVSEILFVDQERKDSLVSFHGVIISHQLQLSSKPNLFASKNHSSPSYLFPVGHQYTVVLIIRDIEGHDVVTLYVDQGKWVYQLGLLCGSRVVIRRAVKRLSESRNIYCVFASSTNIEVLAYQSEIPEVAAKLDARLDLHDLKGLEIRRSFLSDFVYDLAGNPRVQRLCRVQVRVGCCQHVMLKWQCSRCGQIVTGRKCSKCLSDMQTFNAEAKFVVEDSSGEAILYAGGVLVQAILRLSLKQWTDLEQLTCSAGTIVYVRNWHGRDNHWKTTVDKSSLHLAQHCNSSTYGRMVNILCRQVATKNAGYSRRTITLRGAEHSTLVRSRLLLRCVRVFELDHHAESMALLTTEKNLN